MLGLANVMPRDLIMRGCIIIRIPSDRSISGYKSIGLSVRRSVCSTAEVELAVVGSRKGTDFITSGLNGIPAGI